MCWIICPTLISVKAQEKDLELVFDIDPDLPQGLVGDPLRLGQILLNLCSNAIKFTDEGEIVVCAGIANLGETKLLARFGVRDTGVGLSPEQQGQAVSVLFPGRYIHHPKIRRHRSGAGNL